MSTRMVYRFLPAIALAASLPIGTADAGRFIFGDVTFPAGYQGEGGEVQINVCWAPGTPQSGIDQADRSLRNAIARWNRLQPGSSNIRDNFVDANKVDFESVAVHEIGHCLGLGHPNVGSSVAGAGVNATAALAGVNRGFDVDAGPDGVHGSADDVRGDDENLYYFRRGSNNPFTMGPVVDSTTYSKDVAQLPAGELFPSNAERSVGSVYGVTHTEAVMQHDIQPGQVIRSTTHDDVSALRYAMSGLDSTQGTVDDYRIKLNYSAETGDNCDITVEYSNVETAAASCRVSGYRLSGDSSVYIRSGNIFINDDVDWYFNDQAPCEKSRDLPQNEWTMFSLPCDVGVSTSAKLRNVLGDDLGVDGLGVRWALFSYDYSKNSADEWQAAYTAVGLDDELEAGRGYWLLTKEAGKTINVSGEFPVQVDTALGAVSSSGYGWNIIGSPFRFDTQWGASQVVAADGSLLTLDQADPGGDTFGSTACTGRGGPTDECQVMRFAYLWNAERQAYEVLPRNRGSMGAFDGAWVLAGDRNVKLRMAMPAEERTQRFITPRAPRLD